MEKVGDMPLELAIKIMEEHLESIKPLQLGALYQIVAMRKILEAVKQMETA